MRDKLSTYLQELTVRREAERIELDEYLLPNHKNKKNAKRPRPVQA